MSDVIVTLFCLPAAPLCVNMDSQSPLKTLQEEPSHPSESKVLGGKVDLRLPEEIKKEGSDCPASPLGLLTPWECLLDKVLQGPQDRDNTQIIENLLEEMSALITKFTQLMSRSAH